MMPQTKPTIVIVGGAFHTPANYGKLASALRVAGYEVHVPRLPTTNGARPPNADLATDTALVRGYVESLVQAGRRVLVVGHSYGGQVCSNALHGLGVREDGARPGGVEHILYVAAFALPEGQATAQKWMEFGNPEDVPLVFDIAEDGTAVARDPCASFGLDTDTEAEADEYVANLCRWNGAAMSQPLEGPAAWREVPVSYVHAARDRSVTMPIQKNMVEGMEREGRPVRTFTLETGHSPHLTATREMVDIVDAVVAAAGAK